MIDTAPGQRLDKWLWYARFAKTRSLAQKLIRGGQVRLDREKIRTPNKTVRPGNVLTIAMGHHVRIIEIAALGERRGPFTEAQTLYQDLTPPPVPENSPKQNTPLEPQVTNLGKPDKQARRKAIALKQKFSDG